MSMADFCEAYQIHEQRAGHRQIIGGSKAQGRTVLRWKQDIRILPGTTRRSALLDQEAHGFGWGSGLRLPHR